MRNFSSRLYLNDYLKNPNHFSLQTYYIVEREEIDEVWDDDHDLQWKCYCKLKGLFPMDKDISEEIVDDFWENNIEKDMWIYISGDKICGDDLTHSYNFFSALIDEMELTKEQKEDVFNRISTETVLFMRYHKFPRRIDLFPLVEPSLALQLRDEMANDLLKKIQSL